jgi:hypothetical protein
MHHAHVKRKEQTMNRYTLEDFYNDPARYRRLAQREQARAFRDGLRLLQAWVKDQHLSPRPQLRGTRWIERLG